MMSDKSAEGFTTPTTTTSTSTSSPNKDSNSNEKSSSKDKNNSKLLEQNLKALSDIEKEASLLAKEFYKLSKQLQVSLNHISAASVCCLQTYRDTIDKVCESVDESIVEEQNLLDKAKELSRTMEPIYKLHSKITSIKTVVTALESQI